MFSPVAIFKTIFYTEPKYSHRLFRIWSPPVQVKVSTDVIYAINLKIVALRHKTIIKEAMEATISKKKYGISTDFLKLHLWEIQ